MSTTEMTPAVRDAAERAATKTAADAAMARLTEEFHNSPEQRIVRDQAELDRLQSDPFHMNARAAGNRAAEAQESAVQSRLAVAKAEAEKLHGDNRIEHVLSTDGTSDPLFDGTANGELPMQALRSQVADYRELGLSDETIRQTYAGARYPRHVVAWGQKLFEEKMADPAWVERLARGDKLARKESICMDIIRNATVIADDVQADT